ncbi:hypothetical protein Trydic_g16171 [Trypoxylus dichotomus]
MQKVWTDTNVLSRRQALVEGLTTSLKNPSDAPKILSVGPDRLTTAPLFTSATFECVAEGNPYPTYQWLQRLPTSSDVILERGRESKLHISNVTYDYQGEYVCKATNIISGTERTVQSEAIVLQVVGAPQVLRHITTPEIVVEKGQTAAISLVVCADPRPRVVAWEWGSLRLEAGSEMGRYRVDDIIQEAREDCYLTTLRIKDADGTDSRAYYLVVENDRGVDKHTVQLYIDEPLDMNTVICVGGAGLAICSLTIFGCIYAVRTERCCFARKGDFKPSGLNSEEDLEKNSNGPGGIPADAIYTTASRLERRHNSPETMKQTSFGFNDSNTLKNPRKDIYIGLDTNVSDYQADTLSPNYYSQQHSRSDVLHKVSINSTSVNINKLLNHKKHIRQSLPLTNRYKTRERPKPLQPENEKYYDYIFPKDIASKYASTFYERNCSDHVEL